MIVSDVEDGSAADEAGLRPGMVIYRVGRDAAPTPTKVESLFRDVRPGAAVEFTVGVGQGSGRGRNTGMRTGTVTLIARGE